MEFTKIRLLSYLIVTGCVSGVGCASAPRSIQKVSPEELFERACSPGKTVHAVRGTVWFKTKSEEISGQYAANVLIPRPGQLKLEITNFLGGTEALIAVSEDHYTVTGAKGNSEDRQEGYRTWGGIPLQFATDLFLGRIPCPSERDEKKFSLGTGGDLIVEVSNSGQEKALQKFIYTFRDNHGRNWPESLHWEKLTSPPTTVDFKFDDPEDQTLSPQKWEARSETGAVKVRWRDREVSS